MKMLFILPDISEAHCQKRINALKNLGIEPVILAFERSSYPGKPLAAGYISLGKLWHGQYYRRMLPFLNAIRIVHKSIKDVDVVYTFGQDLLGLAIFSGIDLLCRPKIVCEISDIQPILTRNSLYAKSLRFLERLLLRQIKLLVVTSEAFVTSYYRGIQRLVNIPYLVIENKIDENQMPINYSNNEDAHYKKDSLSIGYFGLLRCRKSLEILILAAERDVDGVHIYLAGVGGWSGFKDEIKQVSNIEYRGHYIAPDELPDLYKRVDMVWAAFPYEGQKPGNWLWARTNRFYESCFFNRPMFVQSGTEDARIVNQYDIGMALDLSDIEDSVARILTINYAQIEKWRFNIARLPKSIYVYSDEHSKLLQNLN